MMTYYYSENNCYIAALIAQGPGGWSTWNNNINLAIDRRIIEWYFAHDNIGFFYNLKNSDSREYAETIAFFHSLGYPSLYLGGLSHNMIQWVPIGEKWHIIATNNGAETIEYERDIQWIQCF